MSAYDFNTYANQQQVQYGSTMPVEQQQAPPPANTSFKECAKSVDSVFHDVFSSTDQVDASPGIVSIQDKNAIAALQNKDSEETYTIDPETINTIVDSVMKELHGEEKSSASTSSSGPLHEAKANLEKQQKEFDALPPADRGSTEWNKAKEQLKEAKGQYNQLVNQELKSAKEDLQVSKKEFNESRRAKVSKEEKAEAKANLKTAETRYLQASRHAIENVVQFAFETKSKPAKGEGDLYLRSNITQLAVPITITEKGDVIIALKSKLADKLGQGGFKSVKLSMVLSFDVKDSLQVSVKKAVSATMAPVSDLDKRSVAIEKGMLTRLQELGQDDPPQGIVESMTVTSYEKKSKNSDDAPGEKIAVVMHLCNSGDLEGKVSKSGDRLSKKETKQVVKDILTGLNWLHRNNIFHSDMKPGNVLLHEEEGKMHGKIGDFGFSRDLADPSQRTYSAGDTQYMAPEIAQMHMKFQGLMEKDPKFNELKDLIEAFTVIQQTLEGCSKAVEEKAKALEELQENRAIAIDLQWPNLAFLDEKIEAATQELAQAKADFKANLTLSKDAAAARDKLYEEIAVKYRDEAYKIDESIFKADVFAGGIILQCLFLGVTHDKLPLLDKPNSILTDKEIAKKEKLEVKQARLSPEVQELLIAMKETDPSKRISSAEALERFEGISKVYVKTIAADDTPVEEAEVESQEAMQDEESSAPKASVYRLDDTSVQDMLELFKNQKMNY